MHTQTVLDHFAPQAANRHQQVLVLARLLGYTDSAIYQWGERVPRTAWWAIYDLSGGHLRPPAARAVMPHEGEPDAGPIDPRTQDRAIQDPPG